MKLITTRRSGSRAAWVTALVALLCAVALSLPLAAHAAPLFAGSAMPPLSLSDQPDKPASVGPSTRWVVFTAEKAVGDMVSAVLTAEPAGTVERMPLVHVADISGTPSGRVASTAGPACEPGRAVSRVHANFPVHPSRSITPLES